jgi:hypothetical protein
MLSRPSTNASIVLQHNSLALESYIEQYDRDEDFKDVYKTLIHGIKVEESYYHVHKKIVISW